VGATLHGAESGGIVNVQAAYYCAAALIRSRRRTGEPIPDWLRQHHAQLDAEIRASMSRSGHESACGQGQLRQEELISAREAAEILSISKRQAQRLACDLDGRIVGARWLFKKATVIEYAEGKRNA
jgi:hypothetical protein